MLFLIANSDGDTTVAQKTEAEFLEELNDGDYGDTPVFLSAIEREGALLLIRGEIVQPKPKTVVQEYEL